MFYLPYVGIIASVPAMLNCSQLRMHVGDKDSSSSDVCWKPSPVNSAVCQRHHMRSSQVASPSIDIYLPNSCHGNKGPPEAVKNTAIKRAAKLLGIFLGFLYIKNSFTKSQWYLKKSLYLEEASTMHDLNRCPTTLNRLIYLKLDHCIMQFQGFDWLGGHGI